MKLGHLVGFALALTVVHDAAAQASKPLTPDELWARADANKDGKVDKAELQATLLPDAKPYIEGVWRLRDKDKDGALSRQELLDNTPPNAINRPRPRPAG